MLGLSVIFFLKCVKEKFIETLQIMMSKLAHLVILSTILWKLLTLEISSFLACKALPTNFDLEPVTVNFIGIEVILRIKASFFCFRIHCQCTKFLICLCLINASYHFKSSGVINFPLRLKWVILCFNPLDLVMWELREIIKKLAFLCSGFEEYIVVRRLIF